MSRTIFHLDLDAFFVSVERILNPLLIGKPVIVGGNPNGRGVISACSYEAREYGLMSGMPIKTAFRLCPQGIYLNGSYTEYSKFSLAVESILKEYAPIIEQASVDEFYMDFTGCNKQYGHFINLASLLQKKILNKLNLPCSIGIASNKTVAKIASDFNKPKGITHVVKGCEEDFLSNLPVEAIPGVGKVMVKALNNMGVYKVKDIAQFPEEYFFNTFGKFGLDLWKKSKGEGSEYLTIESERKSISKEKTFSTDIVDKKVLEAKLFEISGKIAQLLRNRNLLTSTITLKLRYNDFNTLTRAKSVRPTDDDKVIYETAASLFRNAYTRRVGIRLIGISISNFIGFDEQEYLFDEPEINRKKIIRAVNKIRDKFGYDSIALGSFK